MAPQRFHEQFDHIQRALPDVPLAMGPDDSAEFIYEKGVVLARDGEEARVVEDAVRSLHRDRRPDPGACAQGRPADQPLGHHPHPGRRPR